MNVGEEITKAMRSQRAREMAWLSIWEHGPASHTADFNCMVGSIQRSVLESEYTYPRTWRQYPTLPHRRRQADRDLIGWV